MQKLIIVSLAALGLSACGMSAKEMETAKKHFADTAVQQCKCDQIKGQKDHKAEEYSACVREYEEKVRYMKSFFDVVQPSEGQRKEAAKAGESITAACKK
ncbi:MAG: hypothetical protein U1F27_01210 [Turneriella sp.]